MDVYVASLTEPGRLFRNTTEMPGSWIAVELVPRPGSLPVWGATIRFDLERGSRTFAVQQQSGYGGHGGPAAHLGIPGGQTVGSVTVTWPDGRTTTIDRPPPGRRHRVDAPPR